MLAVIDDFDPGTMWEMGYGACFGIDIYTFSDKGYGLNVMLAGCSKGHAKGMTQLREMLNAVKNGAETNKFTADAAT